MSNYNSIHTGAELDEAIGRVIDGGSVKVQVDANTTDIADLKERMTTADGVMTDTAEELSGVENDVADLDRKIDKSPNIINSPDADLDFADDRGYIIMRVTDGHVKTKNFDSSTIESTIEDVVEEKMVDDRPMASGTTCQTLILESWTMMGTSSQSFRAVMSRRRISTQSKGEKDIKP